MADVAGSAIAQGLNVGRIDRWSEWDPICKEPLWLLLSGATDPPEDIGISKRRTRDARGDRNGAFLAGVTSDLRNMEKVVGTKLHNTVRDLYLIKDRALEQITGLFEKCKNEEAHPVLYYTGHGEIGTGNWCFHDGTISIQEIFNMVPAGCFCPMIFSDACYSGHWANFCLQKGIAGFNCLAACPEYSTAVDNGDEGGELTLFMIGKKARPSTEPMYSGGNLQDFPITTGYSAVNYTEFVSSHVFNSKNILISQSMNDGTFSGIFASSKLYQPRPSITWGIKENYENFLAFVNKEWNMVNGNSKRIYSLACDEKFGFGVFLMKGYGTSQCILTGTSDVKQKWGQGLRITACAALASTFYIIMTKDTKEYQGKTQRYFIVSTWKTVTDGISEGYQDGMIITGICYSTGLKKYFVVMTKSTARQCHRWYHGTYEDDQKHFEWTRKKWEEGFHPTITFLDPTDKMSFVVMTKDNNKPREYKSRLNYQLK